MIADQRYDISADKTRCLCLKRNLFRLNQKQLTSDGPMRIQSLAAADYITVPGSVNDKSGHASSGLG